MQAIWCLLPTVNLPPIRARRPGSIVITFTRKFPGSFISFGAIRTRLQCYLESGVTPGSPFNPAGPGGPAGSRGQDHRSIGREGLDHRSKDRLRGVERRDKWPTEDDTLTTTVAIGPSAIAMLGRAAIGVHTSVALDVAAIGGGPMVIGIGTIIRWTGLPMLFPTSNMRMVQTLNSRRRRRSTCLLLL
jgi:hypothetical protein